ncbi:hypothetical protein AIOL_004800 [Candidatus Rhodobacter oscarellae]|uniref:Uncharacterized protein n=1 Tax=Candidatus Rhodobacter oscarellae TaxID=1675527 RepID=A0A0J9EB10_9RHOB|nr:hypothetical protein AIOL_004800 [Candidatus Rhodobacter lobularis]
MTFDELMHHLAKTSQRKARTVSAPTRRNKHQIFTDWASI